MSQRNVAQHAFLYFLALVALHIMAINVGVIIFAIINKFIPDVYTYYDGINSAFKFGISALIIASPIYFFTTYKINKALFKGDLDNESGVRKWLSYLILFIAAVVIIGQSIAVLFNYFDGELTTRFILKAITVLILSAIVFSHYLYDIKRHEVKEKKDTIIMTYFIIALGIVLASIITAFVLMESPQMTRARNIDNQIINQLSSIEQAINEYYRINTVLPTDLQQLVGKNTGYYLAAEEIKDNQTQQIFTYNILGEMQYELCADFKTSSLDTDEPFRRDWAHDQGRECFTRIIPEYLLDPKR